MELATGQAQAYGEEMIQEEEQEVEEENNILYPGRIHVPGGIGNSVREAAVQGMPPIKAILVSFRFTLFYARRQS